MILHIALNLQRPPRSGSAERNGSADRLSSARLGKSQGATAERRDPLQSVARHVEGRDLQEGVDAVLVDVQLGGDASFLQRSGKELRK